MVVARGRGRGRARRPSRPARSLRRRPKRRPAAPPTSSRWVRTRVHVGDDRGAGGTVSPASVSTPATRPASSSDDRGGRRCPVADSTPSSLGQRLPAPRARRACRPWDTRRRPSVCMWAMPQSTAGERVGRRADVLREVVEHLRDARVRAHGCGPCRRRCGPCAARARRAASRGSKVVLQVEHVAQIRRPTSRRRTGRRCRAARSDRSRKSR